MLRHDACSVPRPHHQTACVAGRRFDPDIVGTMHHVLQLITMASPYITSSHIHTAFRLEKCLFSSDIVHPDLVLNPQTDTQTVSPWRPDMLLLQTLMHLDTSVEPVWKTNRHPEDF